MAATVSWIGIMFAFSTVLIPVLTVYLFSRVQKMEILHFTILIISFLMATWSMTDTILYLMGTVKSALLLFRINTTLVFFLGPSMLVFVRKYVEMDSKIDMLDILAFAPSVFIALVFWSPYSDFVYSNIHYAFQGGIYYVAYQRGILAYVHLALLYSFAVVSFFYVMRVLMVTKNSILRRNYVLVYISLFIPILVSISSLFTADKFWAILLSEMPCVFYNISLAILIILTVDYNSIAIMPLTSDIISGSISHPILIINTLKRVVHINPSMCNYLGLDEDHPDRYTNWLFADMKKEVDMEFGRRLLKETEEMLKHVELSRDFIMRRVETKDSGMERYVDIMVFAIKSGSNDIGYTVEYVDKTVDITMERQLTNRQKELEFLNDLMTHDLRNALQIMTLNTEILLRKVKDDNERKHLINIDETIKRINNLMDNLRILAHLKGVKLRMTETDVAWIARQAADDIAKVYKDRAVDIYLPEEGKFMAMGDELLYHIFQNLFDNSVKYCRHDKVEIDVSMRYVIVGGKKMLRISVEDNASGIPDEDKEKIFDRYRRIVEKKGVMGSGLGLSIVATIVDMYGGTIYVEDRVKGDHTKGSRFVVTLPA